MTFISRLLSTSLFIGMVTPAFAADLPTSLPPSPAVPAAQGPELKGLYVRAGVSGLFIDGSATVAIGGQPQPGGNGTIPPVAAFSVEGGYFLTHSIAISVSAGFPPHLSSYGTGSFAPFGKIYAVTAGVPTATIHYHLDLGRLHPYVGGGIGYAIVFHSSPAAVQNARLDNAFAPVLVGGTDVDLTEHVSLFFDVKKIWLSQTFKGTIAPIPGVPISVPVAATIRTDPLITTAGIGYRF